jgi:hypothetical protein
MEFSAENWEKAKDLLDRALELDPTQRAAFLSKNCPDDALRRQIEQLLVNYQKAGSLLDDPVFCSLEPEASDASPTSQDSIDLAETVATESEDPFIGRQLGAYKLIRHIGQGGMAVVYLAARADDEYHKQVAIKVVQPGPDNRGLLVRFRNERQTLAGLDHPNIVRLLDGGRTPDGLPFMVMDYVEGRPIDDYCDQHNLCVDDRLKVFSKVCEAVDYAHQKGVVHRDLKPSNILVGFEGTPKLLDFGIAKVLNPDDTSQFMLATHTGSRCMTPAYASPEQIRGKPVTPATDIYSLGIVLYELLSGHRPYRLTQNTPAEIERAICEQDPETPSTAIDRVETHTSGGAPVMKTPELVSRTREGPPDRLRRRLRGDLDNIVLKALQKEPERRYGSVGEFAQDIHRHLQHLPVRARRCTLAYRATKLVQRRKIEAGALLFVVLVLAAAASLAFNPFGLRERVFEGFSSASPQLLNRARSLKDRGQNAGSPATAMAVVPCESLVSLNLPDTTITVAHSVAAGSFTPPGDEPIPNLPDFCRVEGMIKPVRDSNIQFEVWLPSSGWNRKFKAVGNGGFAGSMDFGAMAAALRNGYATAATDTGHRGDIVNNWDASWALGSPEKVVDFGYRAVHEMTEKARATIRAFYGQAPRWSYFEGASNGGREALMEAQRFPDDYQGILAGAPALFSTRLLAAAVYNIQVPSMTNLASYIPASKIPGISAAVLAACDALDGVTDGILNDPRHCHFDPSVLSCAGAETDDCLTSAQIAQLKRIYVGLRNAKGEQIFPGYMPGGEEGDGGWKYGIIGAGPGQGLISTFGINYFRYMVFGNPAWDFRTVTSERALQIADEKTAQMLNATDPDLRQFKARGGKLILYQGWSDPIIPGLGTINYYDSVVAKMGLQETEAFIHLYMAPGMQHVYGGPGPNFFGQFDFTTIDQKLQGVAAATDPQHNISSALERWVEKGTAPASIIAAKYVNDTDPAQGVKMTRPLCPYPQIATYTGTGDTNDAANFECTVNK